MKIPKEWHGGHCGHCKQELPTLKKTINHKCHEKKGLLKYL